jgi:glycosyltransferase involved in cell wall biosynthesis
MIENGKNPAVSVIVPAYGVTQYIGEALDSVLAQTWTDYEIIVVNDGCRDTPALERVLQPYLGRIIYLKQENGGPSSARNTGIRASRAPFVALLDGDDAWEPDFLEVQMGIFKSDPSIDLLYSNAIMFGDTPFAGRLGMDFSPSEGEVTFESLVSFKCMVLMSVTARKEALVRAGWFDENLRRSEDFDLWLRVVKTGGRIQYHRRPLTRYRQRNTGLSADGFAMRQGALAVMEKAERTLDLTPAERKTVQEAKVRFQADADYFSGWQALRKGDTREALRALEAANRYYRGPRLAVFLLVLKTVPSLAAAGAKFFNRGG